MMMKRTVSDEDTEVKRIPGVKEQVKFSYKRCILSINILKTKLQLAYMSCVANRLGFS